RGRCPRLLHWQSRAALYAAFWRARRRRSGQIRRVARWAADRRRYGADRRRIFVAGNRECARLTALGVLGTHASSQKSGMKVISEGFPGMFPAFDSLEPLS